MNGRMRVYVCQTLLTIKRRSAPTSENKRDNFFAISAHGPKKISHAQGEQEEHVVSRQSVFANITHTAHAPVDNFSRILFSRAHTGRSHLMSERMLLFSSHPLGGADFIYLFPGRLNLCWSVLRLASWGDKSAPAGCPQPPLFLARDDAG